MWREFQATICMNMFANGCKGLKSHFYSFLENSDYSRNADYAH